MKAVKAIIADDEAPLRQFLRARLSEAWPELVICGEAKNGQEALELIEREHPEIAFLDIRMPGLSGMEVAAKITGACRVVFVTAYAQHAVEAFEREAVDYLLKPVSPERLLQTVSRLKKEMAADPNSGPISGISAELLNRIIAGFSEKKPPAYPLCPRSAGRRHPPDPCGRGDLFQGRRQVHGGHHPAGGIPHP